MSGRVLTEYVIELLELSVSYLLVHSVPCGEINVYHETSSMESLLDLEEEKEREREREREREKNLL